MRPGEERHFGFRDVFEANGRAVRDRDERLTELFLDPAPSLDRQILSIVADSARYNVGDITMIRGRDDENLRVRGRYGLTRSPAAC